jgi:hypothetical protein
MITWPFLMGLTTKTPLPWIGEDFTTINDRSTFGGFIFLDAIFKRLGCEQ